MPQTSSSTLVVYAHAAPHRSRVNRQLVNAARSLPHVHVQDLYETYPDYLIDVAYEQALLEDAQLVVLLHPIQWYSMPSLLKEWIDVVFAPGWAFGQAGGALAGKRCWLVASTGGGADSFAPGAKHGRPFDDFLAPYEQMAALCGMQWMAPHILHGAHQAGEAALAAHVEQFRHVLAGAAPRLPQIADSRSLASDHGT